MVAAELSARADQVSAPFVGLRLAQSDNASLVYYLLITKNEKKNNKAVRWSSICFKGEFLGETYYYLSFLPG